MIRHCGRFKCSEPENHIENYMEASSDNKRWDIHHRLETHKYNKNIFTTTRMLQEHSGNGKA